jgi:hypothetical protein
MPQHALVNDELDNGVQAGAALEIREHEGPIATHAPRIAVHHLEDLWQLGRIGHVRAIHAKLDDIEAEDPTAKSVTAHLRGLVESFAMKRYMEVIRELRAED